MAKQQSITKSASQETAKNPAIGKAREDLSQIVRHLGGLESLLAGIEEDDDWAHAVGFALQAVRGEVIGVRDSLMQIEKGGAK